LSLLSLTGGAMSSLTIEIKRVGLQTLDLSSKEIPLVIRRLSWIWGLTTYSL
jgi:hypothetical protein